MCIMMLHTYHKIGRLWDTQQLHGSRHMVVLQRRLVIVGHSQRVGSFDEEIIVEAAMLKVMDSSRPTGAEQLHFAHSPCLHGPSMTQQHVCHLHHRCGMHIVVVGILGLVASLNLLQEGPELSLVHAELV